ncbi:PDZ domain-containing protein [Novipirellula sp. SH528]|uniref:PDZ domain-containing protein n=1 Tax=Novipirellula sp. SH528 TaxID=3454466 RepID=UPI003FA15686
MKRVSHIVAQLAATVVFFQFAGTTSLRGDDQVPPATAVPVAIASSEHQQDSAAKDATVMEGTLPPPKSTSTKIATPTVSPQNQATQAKTTSDATRPRLGVNVNAQRAIINRVYPDSGAAVAGVKAGGLIVAVDNQPVNSTNELKRIIASRTSSDTVKLKVQYEGASTTVGSSTRTPWIKTFDVSLAQPKVIFLELPAPVKDK